MITDFYVDDRWGIEPRATVASAFETTEAAVSLQSLSGAPSYRQLLNRSMELARSR